MFLALPSDVGVPSPAVTPSWVRRRLRRQSNPASSILLKKTSTAIRQLSMSSASASLNSGMVSQRDWWRCYDEAALKASGQKVVKLHQIKSWRFVDASARRIPENERASGNSPNQTSNKCPTLELRNLNKVDSKTCLFKTPFLRRLQSSSTISQDQDEQTKQTNDRWNQTHAGAVAASFL